MVETGFLQRDVKMALCAAEAGAPVSTVPGPLCPKCSQPGLVREAGCMTCVQCGWSKCS